MTVSIVLFQLCGRFFVRIDRDARGKLKEGSRINAVIPAVEHAVKRRGFFFPVGDHNDIARKAQRPKALRYAARRHVFLAAEKGRQLGAGLSCQFL